MFQVRRNELFDLSANGMCRSGWGCAFVSRVFRVIIHVILCGFFKLNCRRWHYCVMHTEVRMTVIYRNYFGFSTTCIVS